LTANASSRRFKHDIKQMDKASEAILALKPVSFRYNNDSTDTPWFGLIAEDVAEINPDLIARDKEGKPFGVRYDQINVMLLNEFLKAHRRMEEQEATIAKQQKQIETLSSGLQKVSAQVELNKPAPQTVLNGQ
jgi:Chaperone of endosialidase